MGNQVWSLKLITHELSPHSTIKIESPQVFKLDILVIFASKDIQTLIVHIHGVTCPWDWRFSIRISWINICPFMRFKVKTFDFVRAASVLKSSKDNHFASILAKSVLIDLARNGPTVFSLGRQLVPVHCLQIQTVHLILRVVAACHTSPDQVHIFACNCSLMMWDFSRLLSDRCTLFPFDWIVCICTIIARQFSQITKCAQVEWPKVLHGPNANIVSTENEKPKDNVMIVSKMPGH
jgi:hypothetical protein